MKQHATLILELDSEVQASLQSAEVDLLAALRDEGISIGPPETPPGLPARDGTKVVELLILSVGASAPFVALAVERIIRAVTNRPIKAVARRWTAARNAAGDVLRDERGQPLMEYTEEPKILEGSHAEPPAGEGAASFLGLKFSYKQN